ncbi:hypothetical protein CspeluHIS016_0100730 [Cutaneotrichosporon spelunceum]|uniref:Uncharacterized protein n=1 Tax=Cutaneotrichosporon spelunceum TaxID=1672016 RepID=A0AAD3TN53_9TREE|nr:hypothetical protein CspeluHIS016_0100730 [Cutaneotrichosporon spelunceum]
MPKLSLSDIARAIALPTGRDKVHTPKTSAFEELDEVRRQLHTRRARAYPPYVLSVLSAYIRWRGVSKRTRPALEATLHRLEAEFPEFAAEFRAVHKSYGLAWLARDETKSARSTCACTLHAAAVAELDAREASAAPPPPYAPDADADLARWLAHRLAAEAGPPSCLYAAGRDAEEALDALDAGVVGVPAGARGRGRTQGDAPSHGPPLVV